MADTSEVLFGGVREQFIGSGVHDLVTSRVTELVTGGVREQLDASGARELIWAGASEQLASGGSSAWRTSP